MLSTLNLLAIEWTVDPDFFTIPGIDRVVRWYGVLFATAFFAGYYVLERVFKAEGHPKNWMDSILIYVMIATVVGARLGHVFFYDWDYYSQNPGEILAVWNGGLASHGAAIAILIALYLFSKRITKKPYIWILDRITLPVIIGGFFIRMGNLMNHEIIGTPTDVAWGFLFTKAYGIDPTIPRHPAQLYEAIGCLIIFGVLMWLYWKKDWGKYSGKLFGVFLTLLWTSRFLVEFVKTSQGGFESSLGNILSTGQWLSIPLIIVGVYLWFRPQKA